MAETFALIGDEGLILASSASLGRSFPVPGLIIAETASAATSFAVDTIASTLTIGDVTLGPGPITWTIPFMGDDGPIVFRGASRQIVALPGIVVRGVDDLDALFQVETIPSAEQIGMVNLSDAALRGWCVPFMGDFGPILVRGLGGAITAHEGLLARSDEPFGVIFQVGTVPSTLVVNNVTFIEGRLSSVLRSPGFAANPIGTL